jgi:diguanylate cyclase (GGDEF)-like protein
MRSGVDNRPGAKAGDAALLAAVLESIPFGFSVWDENYCLSRWNRRYLDIYNLPADMIRKGMSLEEVCAVTVAAGNHPGKTPAEVYRTYLAWLREQGGSTAHVVHRKTIGIRTIDSTYTRAPGVGWVVTHEDITEQVTQIASLEDRERQLQLQNLRFEAAVNTMGNGLCMFDRDMRLVICNDQYAGLYHLPSELRQPGTPLKVLLEHRVENGIFPTGQRETYVAERLALAQTGEPNEHVVQMNDGRYLRVAHRPMADGGWVATQQDVTESIHQVHELEKREAAVQLEKLRLQAAVDNMSHGLCLFDSSRRLVICNERYARLYGLPPDLITPGTSLARILDYRIEHGLHPVGGKEAYLKRRFALVEDGVESTDVVELQDGRIIEIHHQPMVDGGWVSTHQDITEQRRNEEKIRYLARHDALTDLPNRTLFSEDMEAAEARIRRGEPIAVLCIDLDHFKSVNDTLGHTIGDAVLREVGHRLKTCCRGADIVARLGGDEFAVLIGPLRQPSAAAMLAERVVKSIAEPFDIGDHRVLIGASIGIAVSPNDGADATTLFKNADLALYRAKGEGRSTFHFFEKGMDAALQERRNIEVGLRHALANGDLRLVFQPLLSLSDRRICGLEALLRWYHPERGTIAPDAFVPIAEETGLIVPIGEWVLREACSAARDWPDHIRIAVNLSPVQFKSRHLVDHVRDALAAASLAPDRLELEVTETLLLGENPATLRTLHQLRELGVRISMDDFGTGYSSLNYLRSFPFDKIKIDRTFVHELSTAAGDGLAIVKAVIGLGRSLGISTAAEGVETEAQLDLVVAQGCTEVQGFFFSPPLPAAAVNRLLANGQDFAAMAPNLQAAS